jgi:hypothetical protein
MCFFHDKTIKHLLFQCKFACSIWSIIQVVSTLYLPHSVANIFGNWLHGMHRRSRIFLSIGTLTIIGRFGYAKVTKFLMIIIVLSYMLFTCVPIYSFMVVSIMHGESRPVYGGVYTMRDSFI